MLKTHSNGPDKDNLLSYFGTDRVMQAQMQKANAARQPDQQAAPAPVKRQMPNGRMVSEAAYKAWRKRGGKWPGED